MISPVTETMSPKSISDFHASSSSCPTLSRESIAWSSVPSPSRKVAKQSFPVSRLKIIRPVRLSISPVATSTSRPVYFWRTSCKDLVRGTATGYGSIPRSRRLARFSRRIRSCSGRSSSAVVGFSEVIVRRVYPRLDSGGYQLRDVLLMNKSKSNECQIWLMLINSFSDSQDEWG